MKIQKRFLLLIIFILSINIISISQNENVSKFHEFALFLSGKQFPASIKDTTINLEFWYKYQEKINKDWSMLDSMRLNPMLEWANSEITPRINDTLTLFYPFSGPDFLHAYVLFPNSNEYIFLAQEQLGSIPDFTKMKQKDLVQYLDNFYFSIRDIYQRSYFITGRMDTDLNNARVRGVLPVILFFLVKTGNCIHDVSYEKLSMNLTFNPIKTVTGDFSSGECVKIEFSKKDSGEVKTLRYFRCDASDEGFESVQLLKEYLCLLGNFNTYVKSASYLLHYETFSTIRNRILENSKAVLQDDTGIPYKYFSNNNWNSFLYGVYVKPIEDFPNPYLLQKDLKEIYDEGSVISPLPFSLGYHWRSGEQNQMLFIKK